MTLLTVPVSDKERLQLNEVSLITLIWFFAVVGMYNTRWVILARGNYLICLKNSNSFLRLNIPSLQRYMNNSETTLEIKKTKQTCAFLFCYQDIIKICWLYTTIWTIYFPYISLTIFNIKHTHYNIYYIYIILYMLYISYKYHI